MIKASKYIIERTTDPVINFYKKNSKNTELSKEQYDVLSKLNGNAKYAKMILSKFKKTGDVYKYLLSITKATNEQVGNEFRKFGFVPFEDILSDFREIFKDELDNVSTVDDLILEELYSTWDVIFLANIYRAQTYGILSIKNRDDEVLGVVVRGEFDSATNNYANTWINDNELRYHLIGEDSTKNHINNRYILSGNYPIYVFHTVGSNEQVYRGKFKFIEYDENAHQVHLQRDDSFSNDNNKRLLEYKLPTRKEFTKQIDRKDSVKFGTSIISENKIKSGAKAENIVLEHFIKLGISVINVADNTNYPYDLLLSESQKGLEVKNITNGSFYISENEIRHIENGTTKLVFVDGENILISKSYEELKELKKTFEELREIDSFIIDKYQGIYSSEELKIAITNTREDRIKEDFILINNLSAKELIELF